MIVGSSEELQDYCKKLKCPDHPKAELVVAWHESGTYVIRCGAGHYPEELVEDPPPTRQFKQGTIEKVDPTFSLIPKADLGTGELIGPAMIEALRSYARIYGLDADRGHVVIYYGAPYIGLDGYLYHANQLGEPYTLASRPLTSDERSVYQIPEGAHAWLATVKIIDTGAEFTGLGIVTKDETTEMSKKRPDRLRSPVVAAHPWQLAQKRAEWQAMRRVFPIGNTGEEKEE